ncbi:BTB/POZ domain-containing protein 2 [Orchesella cincta]|uniref:BTB/POZ domain-containing protein 2 n=1 Tax=Orchesella cincta TaxID=48709 RepID=A0A1D2MRG8_ORCCI|nr:BTB/POZ domain-containing protein 2 [Orchesella cincta]
MSTTSSSPGDPPPEEFELSFKLPQFLSPEQAHFSRNAISVSTEGTNSSSRNASPSHVNAISNWREPCPLPTDKLGYILDNQVWHDVKFLIGEPPNAEIMTAHKLILAMSSTVFEAMLFGPLSNAQEEVINIPDVDPTAFSQMLKFIYTGNFDASIQNAVDLMYAAKKYDVQPLTIKCSELLRSDLTAINAVTILQAAQLLDEKELERKAESFLISNFGKVIDDEDFLTMTYANLCFFLGKDELDVGELDLFFAALRWAETECTRQGVVEATPDSQRVVLRDAIFLLRFPLISAEDFSLAVVPQKILTSDEALSILQYLTVSHDKKSQLSTLPFNSRARNTNNVYTAHFAVRLTDLVYPYVSHISYFDSFEVDQSISIVSFGFPAPDIDDAAYDVALQVQVQGSSIIIAQTNQSLAVKRRSTICVKFEKPVRIEPNVIYKVVYKLKGPDTFYADQRIENYPVKSKNSKSKTVNFRYIAYSCRLVEIAFLF